MASSGIIKGTSALVTHMAEGAKKRSGKSLLQFQSDQQKAWRERDAKTVLEKASSNVSEEPMLKLQSNFARNRVVDFGSIFVTFNEDGIAEVPAHARAQIDAVRRRRPGRFNWVVEQVAEPEVTPIAPAEVFEEPSLEEELAQALEETQVEETEAQATSEPEPKPEPKKTTRRRKTTKKKVDKAPEAKE